MFNYPIIDPVAISLGPLNIHWYAISYLLGFFVCWRILLSMSPMQKQPWTKDALWDLISYGVFGVILGGRMGYVLFYGFDQFLSDPLSLLRIWQGGMSFHGGLLGVIAALSLYARRHGRRFLAVTDFVAPGAPRPRTRQNRQLYQWRVTGSHNGCALGFDLPRRRGRSTPVKPLSDES